MIDEFATKNNLPKYRITQFNEAYYKQAIDSFEELTTWPKKLREDMEKTMKFSDLEFEREFVSANNDTIKVLFKTSQGKRIETVLMRHEDGRNTVCVSCMVGCPVNCKFCATGKMGFSGNLTAKEIVDQIMYFQRWLKKYDEKLTNIVYMGMGEPMLNLEAVQESIKTITDPDKLAMSQRRVTVSTSGYVNQLRKFIQTGFRGRMAISLHAPNQELRAKLMPVAKQHSLTELMETLDEYTKLTNKRISYEYVMIKDVNDQEEHALELYYLFRHRLAHINLIPYNPIKEEKFERSSKSQIRRFTDILQSHRINYSIRVTMGDDVNAACGQLADRENKKYIERMERLSADANSQSETPQ